MPDEEINVLVTIDEVLTALVEEEVEPINILVDDAGHGVNASIFDHIDAEKIGGLLPNQAMVYDATKLKFINKLIFGVLQYDPDYDCFIVP